MLLTNKLILFLTELLQAQPWRVPPQFSTFRLLRTGSPIGKTDAE